jgi:hypothetical protein
MAHPRKTVQLDCALTVFAVNGQLLAREASAVDEVAPLGDQYRSLGLPLAPPGAPPVLSSPGDLDGREGWQALRPLPGDLPAMAHAETTTRESHVPAYGNGAHGSLLPRCPIAFHGVLVTGPNEGG